MYGFDNDKSHPKNGKRKRKNRNWISSRTSDYIPCVCACNCFHFIYIVHIVRILFFFGSQILMTYNTILEPNTQYTLNECCLTPAHRVANEGERERESSEWKPRVKSLCVTVYVTLHHFNWIAKDRFTTSLLPHCTSTEKKEYTTKQPFDSISAVEASHYFKWFGSSTTPIDNVS